MPHHATDALRCPRCNRTFPHSRLSRCPHDRGRLVPDRAGQVLADRYTLHALVGVGGMGTSVWSAWQANTERLVALKLLPPSAPAERERFVMPVPGAVCAPNSMAGKTVVMTGVFPEVGGGAGLDLGKARVPMRSVCDSQSRSRCI